MMRSPRTGRHAGNLIPAKTIAVLSLLLVSACAHQPIARHATNGTGGMSGKTDGEPETLADVLNADPKDPEKTGVIKLEENGTILFRGTKLKNTKFDYPVTINSRVEYWVDYFCGRGRPHFERYLERSEFFIPYIDPILKKNDMPRDLVYLAMIESGFNNLARSRAKAVGPWQFMAATGTRYGLSVNWWVDERRDIDKSTIAAVEYLRELHTMFGSWELAAAAYNAGEAKVARAISRYGTNDFWSLARHRFLRPETRDYVPKIIAAAIIDKNREQFGFKLPKATAAPDEAVAPSGELVKVIKTDQPMRDTADLSPEVADASATVDGDADETEEFDSDEPESATGEKPVSGPVAVTVSAPVIGLGPATAVGGGIPVARPIHTPHVNKAGEVGGEELVEFEIESPADLLKVATAAGLSYQTVKSLNPEILRWCTPPTNNTYRLKLPVSTKERFLATYNHEGFAKSVDFLVYHARSGDTLTRIAARFGIKADPVAQLNRLPIKARLPKGARVLLPIPNDRSRSLASLEVKDPPEHRRSHRRRRPRHVNSSLRDSARATTHDAG